MYTVARHHRRARTLAVVLATALVGACADPATTAPDGPPASPTRPTLPDDPLVSEPMWSGASIAAGTGADVAAPAACPTLQVPAGSTLALRLHAVGVQVYRWTGMSWTFVAPEATLYADAGGRGRVGDHSAGPTWRSVSGSRVVGTVVERCTPDTDAIPWLLLAAVPDGGPGAFAGTTFIQRVQTVGGLAPATAGQVAGELARVPYTAVYLFYRG